MKTALLTLLMVMVFGHATTTFGQTATLSNAEITFEFPSKKVRGSIKGFQSTSFLDWEQPENSVFKGSVDVETLDTRNRLRNWSLKNRRYFNADDHPRIYFESSNIVLENDRWLVHGQLTLKGVAKPMTIAFQKEGSKLIGTTTLYSFDHGIKIKKKREDNLVKVKMVFDLN